MARLRRNSAKRLPVHQPLDLRTRTATIDPFMLTSYEEAR